MSGIKTNPSIPLYRRFQRWVQHIPIGQKIAWGYGISLGVAIAGTTTGLAIGNYYHEEALARQKDAVEEFVLLDHLHNSALQTRLYRLKLAYVLDKPSLLATEYRDFLYHKREFEKTWAEFLAIDGHTQDAVSRSNLVEVAMVDQFLQTYRQVPHTYFREVDKLFRELSLPNLQPARVAEVRARLDAFVLNPAVEPLERFSEDLIPLVRQATTDYENTENALIAAQIVRFQWIVWSMIGSAGIAALLAYYTSRAIAQPIHSLTQVVRQVTQESNFDLQAPVTAENEVGLLAVSFNQLVAQVKALLKTEAETQTKLAHDALHDALTGLPNRQLFQARLSHAIELNKRQSDYRFAVLFLDLDRFKTINDTFGHTQGDQLLIKIAQRLRPCLRTVDFAARLGGDEFAILLEAINQPEEVSVIADRIQAALALPMQLNQQVVRVTSSIGIALNTAEYNDLESILCNADIAMYRAKAQGRDQYAFFDASLHEQVLSRLQLETDLRQVVSTLTLATSALQQIEPELYIAYQPIVDLKTQKLVGFEALLRWQHPQRGLIPPLEFIPVAEETEMIVAIGHWVLQAACAQLAKWQQTLALDPAFTMSVNLSGRQLLQSNLAEQIHQILRETGLPPTCLRLELTETVLIEQAYTAIATLHSLRVMGIQLAIDDFGIGYSSLSYLHRFPVNILKIDRQFVTGVDLDCKKLILVRAIISLAQNLNMEVVAEGVETIQQLTQLSSLECKYGQGYLFSEPVTSEVATQLISDWTGQCPAHYLPDS
jgi:diguanylate cyclase (GGDEF)-like protein